MNYYGQHKDGAYALSLMADEDDGGDEQLWLYPDFYTMRRRASQAPAQAHSPTSREAAERIEPAADTLRARVLEHLRACGSRGATDQEIQWALGMDPSTERPRRVELVNAGLVTATDGDTRPTFSGRQAQVWRAVE